LGKYLETIAVGKRKWCEGLLRGKNRGTGSQVEGVVLGRKKKKRPGYSCGKAGKCACCPVGGIRANLGGPGVTGERPWVGGGGVGGGGGGNGWGGGVVRWVGVGVFWGSQEISLHTRLFQERIIFFGFNPVNKRCGSLFRQRKPVKAFAPPERNLIFPGGVAGPRHPQSGIGQICFIRRGKKTELRIAARHRNFLFWKKTNISLEEDND